MQVENSYFWFKEALTPDQCQKIIDLGVSEIERIKKAGGSAEATTFGDNHKQGLEKLDAVDLVSHFKKEKRTAKKFLVIPYNIPKQCTATYFPEANVLVPIQSKARISNTPTSKTVIITIHKKTEKN